MPIGTMAAATAAAVPPLEPPAVTLTSVGLRVVPKTKLVVLMSWANSGVLVLPTMTPPAAFRRATEIASSAGTSCSKIREPNVVRSPAVCRISLTTNGTPSSGRGAAPLASRRSHASAAAIASGFRVQIAFSTGLSAPIRSSNARATAAAESSRPATAAAISPADS